MQGHAPSACPHRVMNLATGVALNAFKFRRLQDFRRTWQQGVTPNVFEDTSKLIGLGITWQLGVAPNAFKVTPGRPFEETNRPTEGPRGRQDGPRRFKAIPSWPQDDPNMAAQISQDGPKMNSTAHDVRIGKQEHPKQKQYKLHNQTLKTHRFRRDQKPRRYPR